MRRYEVQKTLAIFALFFVASSALMGQKEPADRNGQAPSGLALSDLANSANQAAAIVDRAIRTSGGHARLDELKSIGLDFEAEVAATFQGPNPKNPHRYLPRTGDLFFDVGRRQLITSSETRWPNFITTVKSLYRDDKTFTLDEQTKTFRESNDAEVIEAWSLRLMPVVLKRLKDNPMSLAYADVVDVAGNKHDVVLSTLGTNRIYRVYFSRSSFMPEIVENLDYSSDFGDMTVTRTFAGFREAGGFLIPTSVQMLQNGHRVFSYTLKNISMDRPAKENALDLPKDFQLAPAAVNPPKMNTHEIAKGVYLIENLAGRDYNVMFADLGKSVVVFEAPIDMWASKIALAEIRKVFPEKPIRFVMVSHFHDDHAAGIRNYMAEGIAVITTPGNREHFEKIARLPHTFHGENNLLKATEPKFEIVRNKLHQIKGNDLTVQFLDLGPNAHVDENIVAYIPEREILFQGDFFRVPIDRSKPERIRDEGLLLLQKIKENGLAVKQLVGAHGPTGSVQDLERALEVRSTTPSN